jgi:phage tail protein X
MRDYSTAQGDTWDIVSFKVYGNEKKVAELIEANPAYRNTVFFAANVKLKVPDIVLANAAPSPPWMK